MATTFRWVALLCTATIASSLPAQQSWSGFGGNAQHTGNSSVASLALDKIVWKASVDVDPPYSGNHLLAHYGSPAITPDNTVIFPIRTLSGGFKLQARNGATGSLVWASTTTYKQPPHNWYPGYGLTLVPPASEGGPTRLAWAEIGGRVSIRSNADAPTSSKTVKVFYGGSAYAANRTLYNENVRICTPLTAGSDGSIYFGYVVLGDTPKALASGLARIAPDGKGSYVSAATLSGDPEVKFVKRQSAPALSNDGEGIYTVVSAGNFSRGYLVKLDSKTLAPLHRVLLKDPRSGLNALIDDDGTASPLVAPDGDVYVGVLENAFASNSRRGWLLHFNGDLSKQRLSAAFGWDTTPSIVPASAVPFYTGTSPYLLFTKYNEYGSWIHRLALLDPFDSQRDFLNGTFTMRRVATQLNPTPDPGVSPNATHEWCINSAVVDIPGMCALANASDGRLYRWDFLTNTLSESIRLTSGIGEAYAPITIGPDGRVYAINNARLFGVGSVPRS